ncbi:MAG TPA: hypothetical protein VME44_09640 [Streptosporangiaceae bacterium]|nr:hypothetical protein [Streptosporangiaceae bacterium]HUB39189.1 hypothetical protein [Streptosporangiaceae bacterium]
MSAAAAIGPAALSAPGEGGVCGCGRVAAVFLPAAIWVPSSAARSVFRAVRSPGYTAVSSNWMCSRAAPLNVPSSFSNSASPASSLASTSSTGA